MPMIMFASSRAPQSRPNVHIAKKTSRLNMAKLSILFFFKARSRIHQLRHVTIADGVKETQNHTFVIQNMGSYFGSWNSHQ